MTQKTVKISKETAEKHGYYLFGGKGDVWSNTAHLSHGGMPTTLCGRPMLSTNWVRINGVQEVGCTECARLFDLAISL
jgi:hypothetical protein